MTPEVNISLSDSNEDIAGCVADVLCTLGALLSNQRPQYQLTPQELSGLWVMLTACEHTLKRIH